MCPTVLASPARLWLLQEEHSVDPRAMSKGRHYPDLGLDDLGVGEGGRDGTQAAAKLFTHRYAGVLGRRGRVRSGPGMFAAHEAVSIT
jgi:hypothetical protein